jgi:hypothetical protein
MIANCSRVVLEFTAKIFAGRLICEICLAQNLAKKSQIEGMRSHLTNIGLDCATRLKV